MGTLMQCTVLVFLAGDVICGPYANNYPHKNYEYVYDGGRGSTNEESAADTSGFIKNKVLQEGNDSNALQNIGKFHNIDNTSKGHGIENVKQGTSIDAHKQTTGEDYENDKTHNRKHIKSGFSNSYHRDESGTNSSYYEDSDDHGGKLIYDKRHGTRGDNHDKRYRAGVKDDASHDRLDSRYNDYANRGSEDFQLKNIRNEDAGNVRGHRDEYNRGKDEQYEHYNDRRGLSGLEQAHHNDYYKPLNDYLPHRNNYPRPAIINYSPVKEYPIRLPLHDLPHFSYQRREQLDDSYIPRHKITVYEDPREFRRSSNQRNDYDHRVSSRNRYYEPRLEFRPSPLRLRDFDNKDRVRIF